jgi:hypothetical protein
MLLNVDGLDARWKKGVPSPFEGELGWHAVGDVEAYAPLIFRRVRNNLATNDIRSFDASRIPVDHVMYSPLLEKEDEDLNKKNVISLFKKEEKDTKLKIANHKVVKLTNKNFRDKLVIHFHKRWEIKDIVWPSRTGEMTA